MDDLSQISSAEGGIKKLSSKVKASISGVDEGMKELSTNSLQSPKEIREFDIKMEEANHAFALMEEVSEKLKSAYDKLSS